VSAATSASLERGVTIGISDAEARAWRWNRDELYNIEEGSPHGTPKGW
jgi:hypothetical protein